MRKAFFMRHDHPKGISVRPPWNKWSPVARVVGLNPDGEIEEVVWVCEERPHFNERGVERQRHTMCNGTQLVLNTNIGLLFRGRKRRRVAADHDGTVLLEKLPNSD